MCAAPCDIAENQLALFDGDQLELFNGEDYWREPKLPPQEPELESEPEPVDLRQQLGWDNLQQGVIAHAEFDAQMARLGASHSRPSVDPGGGIASDTFVTFAGRTVSVQVKSAQINAEGRAKFGLGPRDGSVAGGHDTRRRARYIGRANFFALAVFNGDCVITDWYLIPADKLRNRVSLTVSPGICSQRLRKGFLEPERYRGRWNRLLDVPSSIQVGTRDPSSIQVGTRTGRMM